MLKYLKARLDNWMRPKDKCPVDMLYQLFFGQTDKLPTTGYLEEVCGLEISKRPVQVAVVHVGDDTCVSEKLNMIVESSKEASDSDEVLTVSDGCNQIIFMFFSDTLWEEQAREILEDVQNAILEVWPDSQLYITLGNVEDYVEKGEPAWRKSFKTAIGLQDYRFVKTAGKLICYSDIIAGRHVYPKGIIFRFDLLKEYLEGESPDLLKGWLSGIYSILSEEDMDIVGLHYHITLEIIVNVVSIFREKGLSAESYVSLPGVLVEQVMSLKTPQELQHWTDTFLDKCYKVLRKET